MMHIVGVIGAGHCDTTIACVAAELGELLSHNGLVVLTSDCGGVMEAASRGAKKTGGLTIGVLPECV